MPCAKAFPPKRRTVASSPQKHGHSAENTDSTADTLSLLSRSCLWLSYVNLAILYAVSNSAGLSVRFTACVDVDAATTSAPDTGIGSIWQGFMALFFLVGRRRDAVASSSSCCCCNAVCWRCRTPRMAAPAKKERNHHHRMSSAMGGKGMHTYSSPSSRRGHYLDATSSTRSSVELAKPLVGLVNFHVEILSTSDASTLIPLPLHVFLFPFIFINNDKNEH